MINELFLVFSLVLRFFNSQKKGLSLKISINLIIGYSFVYFEKDPLRQLIGKNLWIDCKGSNRNMNENKLNEYNL